MAIDPPGRILLPRVQADRPAEAPAGPHLARCSSSPPCSTVRLPWLRCVRTSQPQHRHQQRRSCSGTYRSTCAERTALRAASTCGRGGVTGGQVGARVGPPSETPQSPRVLTGLPARPQAARPHLGQEPVQSRLQLPPVLAAVDVPAAAEEGLAAQRAALRGRHRPGAWESDARRVLRNP